MQMNMRVDGLEQLADELKHLGDNTEDIRTELLALGGEIVAKAWKDEAQERGHVQTGQMLRNIRADKAVRDQESVAIYPRGWSRTTLGKGGKEIRRKTPERNAAKAFILHYGRSKRRGDYWVDSAEERARRVLPDALDTKFLELTEGGKNG